VCRRRQILDHFGDEEECRPSGRCCDVCEPDPVLERVASAPIASGPGRRAGRAQGSGRRSAEPPWAAAEPPGAAAKPPPAAVDAQEFERLRGWRWQRAQGKPAYTVASNAVLDEVLRRRPANVDQLLGIRGIGRSFCEKHGESMLATLCELDERRARGAHVSSGPGV
jgi:superfamily II DNA helicase RecQ